MVCSLIEAECNNIMQLKREDNHERSPMPYTRHEFGRPQRNWTQLHGQNLTNATHACPWQYSGTDFFSPVEQVGLPKHYQRVRDLDYLTPACRNAFFCYTITHDSWGRGKEMW